MFAYVYHKKFFLYTLSAYISTTSPFPDVMTFIIHNLQFQPLSCQCMEDKSMNHLKLMTELPSLRKLFNQSFLYNMI